MGDPVSTEKSWCPAEEAGDDTKEAVDAQYGSPLHNYDRRGRKLPIDAQGK